MRMTTRLGIGMTVASLTLGPSWRAQSAEEGIGAIATTEGPAILDFQLRTLFDISVPPEQWQSQIVVLGQCYSGNHKGSWQDRPKTTTLYASGIGENSYYHGYWHALAHDYASETEDATGGMKPAPGNNTSKAHAFALTKKYDRDGFTENPLQPTGPQASLAPINPAAGPIRSRHTIFYAGKPTPGNRTVTKDYHAREDIRGWDEDTDGDASTVTTVGGYGTSDDWDYPGSLEGLKAALAEVKQFAAVDEQLIFFVGDHGGLLTREGSPNNAGKSASGALGIPIDDCNLLTSNLEDNELVIEGRVYGPNPPIGPVEVRTPQGTLCPDAPIFSMDLDGDGVTSGPGEGWSAVCRVNPAFVQNRTVTCAGDTIEIEVAEGDPVEEILMAAMIAPLETNPPPLVVAEEILDGFAPNVVLAALPESAVENGPTPALLLTGDPPNRQLFPALIDPYDPQNSSVGDPVDLGNPPILSALDGITPCGDRLFASVTAGPTPAGSVPFHLIESMDSGRTWGIANTFGELVVNTRVDCYEDPLSGIATLYLGYYEAGGPVPFQHFVDQADPSNVTQRVPAIIAGNGFAIDFTNQGPRADLSINPITGEPSLWRAQITGAGIGTIFRTTFDGSTPVADFVLGDQSIARLANATSTGLYDAFVADMGPSIELFSVENATETALELSLGPKSEALPVEPSVIGADPTSIDVISPQLQRIELDTQRVTEGFIPDPVPGFSATTLFEEAFVAYGFALQPGSLTLVRPDRDGDGLADVNDPCVEFHNVDPSKDSTFDGVPDECQCGDSNGDGFVLSGDIVVAFLCVLSDPNAQSPPCDFRIRSGDTNNDGSFSNGDLLRMFLTASDPANNPGWALTCPNRPEGTDPNAP